MTETLSFREAVDTVFSGERILKDEESRCIILVKDGSVQGVDAPTDDLKTKVQDCIRLNEDADIATYSQEMVALFESVDNKEIDDYTFRERMFMAIVAQYFLLTQTYCRYNLILIDPEENKLQTVSDDALHALKDEAYTFFGFTPARLH